MGITIVQKSDLGRPRRNPKIALVMSAGAISGGAFKLGGMVALNRFLTNRKVTDFDMYVGLSAGAFIGAFLANGISPEEALRGLDGTSKVLRQFKFYDFYWPAFREYARRSGMLLRDAAVVWPSIAAGFARHLSGSREQVGRNVRGFLRSPSYTTLERVIGPLVSEVMRKTPFPNAGQYVPSGLFDTSRLEQYVRLNLADNGLPNDFRALKRQTGRALYITASNLNTGRGVTFGHDADHTVSISQAVQASVAIPGFYVPPAIGGEEYLDASVRKTANVSLAVHKGADLIIIYNPFRPYMNRSRYQLGPNASSLAKQGLGTVLNQSARMMLQSRLYLGVERLRLDPAFRGDLILIEPTETDAEFFTLNPLAFWNRGEAARHGFESVCRALEQNFSELQRILAAYNLECDLAGLAGELELGAEPTPAPEPDVEPPEAVEVAAPRLRVVK